MRCKSPRGMLNALRAGGYNPIYAFDGEEWEKVSTVSEAVDVIESVDWSNVEVEKDGWKHTIGIILSNGEDFISDWTIPNGAPTKFDQIMDDLISD